MFLHPCCQSIKLKLIVMFTILEYRERQKKKKKEKYREKEKVGGRPSKLNGEKSDRELEREIKNKGDIISYILHIISLLTGDMNSIN